ncbi:MAG: hypothetical protein HY708_08465 [Ignavibacteriae bacterium]|nr:hypothetical protein [Ignavibacteriota bacterium]
MIGKGSMVIVLGFAGVLGYVSFNLANMGTSTVANMAKYHDATASHNLALVGANVGLSKFYSDTSWFGTITQPMSGSVFTGSFTAQMEDLGSKGLRLRSVSTYPSYKTFHDTVEVYFQKSKENSFTIFAWMTNFEGNVFWITGDTVWGRVHSNGALHVNGKPVFMEKVTTSKAFDPKPGTGTNKAIFKKGYETGVAKIDFPTDLSDLINASTSGGHRYATDIWVTLLPGTSAKNDGAALVRQTETGPVIDTINISAGGFNGVILGEQRVNVKGTLDGRLTIASLTDVYIQDDVLYETNPRFATSNDILGLVADRNVVVAKNTANNNNCVIHASIFARDGSFMAEDYSSRPVSGELHLLGSIVQDERGPVGTFSGSTIKSGFSKRYRYDTRLADPNYRPPYYPGFVFKTYAITNWWESYRVPDFD